MISPLLANPRTVGRRVRTYSPFADPASIASVMAKALADLKNGYKVVVYHPDCGSTGVTLTASIPYCTNLTHVVQDCTFTNASNVPDNDIDQFTGGTWYKGDGTFPMFQAQDWDGNPLDADKVTADSGSGGVYFTTTAVRGAAILGTVGCQNFTRALSVGGKNQCGPIYSRLGNFVVKGCTDFAIYIKNCQHVQDKPSFWSIGNANGIFIGADVSSAILQPGNSEFGTLFDNPVGLSAANARKHRSIVLNATTGSNLNEIKASRVQSNNGGNRTKTTYTTLTGGTGQVTLQSGKGAELQVGMSIKVANTGGNGNIAVGDNLFILSISTDTITMGVSRAGSAIGGSFSTSFSFTTYGWGSWEIVGEGTGTISNCSFTNVDLENVAQGALHLERASGVFIVINELYSTSGEQHIVMRGAMPNEIYCMNTFASDVDGSSVQTRFYGTRTIADCKGYTGQWFGRNATSSRFGISIGSQDVTGNVFSFEQREPSGGQFIYAKTPFAQKVYGDRSSSGAINAGQSGYINYTGSGTLSISLPTIDSTSFGLEYVIMNSRSGILTLSTNGSQTFNGLAGKTALTIPAVTGTALGWIRCKAMTNDPSNPASYFWFVELGTGAALS